MFAPTAGIHNAVNVINNKKLLLVREDLPEVHMPPKINSSQGIKINSPYSPEPAIHSVTGTDELNKRAYQFGRRDEHKVLKVKPG